MDQESFGFSKDIKLITIIKAMSLKVGIQIKLTLAAFIRLVLGNRKMSEGRFL